MQFRSIGAGRVRLVPGTAMRPLLPLTDDRLFLQDALPPALHQIFSPGYGSERRPDSKLGTRIFKSFAHRFGSYTCLLCVWGGEGTAGRVLPFIVLSFLFSSSHSWFHLYLLGLYSRNPKVKYPTSGKKNKEK